MATRFDQDPYQPKGKAEQQSRRSVHNAPMQGSTMSGNKQSRTNQTRQTEQHRDFPKNKNNSTMSGQKQRNTLAVGHQSGISKQSNKSALNNGRLHTGSQFFSVANEQDGHEKDIQKDMMRNTYQINMGNKKVSFQLSEAIFSLEEPTRDDYREETQCYVCDKDLKRNHKHACQFCGHKACERCAYKLRVFANQNGTLNQMGENLALSDIQKNCHMGRACRICDRKFFLRASFNQYAAQISYYVEETEAVDEDLTDVQAELDEIEDQNAQVNEMIQEEQQRYHAADETQKKKILTMQQEQDTMRQERDTLQQQIKYRNEQFSKKKRQVTDVDMQKEQLTIKLQRENIKLRESTMQLEQVSKEMSIRQTTLGSSRRPGNSSSFINAKGVRMNKDVGGSMENWDIVNADELEPQSKNTVGSQSVGGKGAIQSLQSVRLRKDSDDDYYEEMRDTPLNLPNGSQYDDSQFNGPIGSDHEQSTSTLRGTEISRSTRKSNKKGGLIQSQRSMVDETRQAGCCGTGGGKKKCAIF